MANQDDITMLLKSSGSDPRAAEALYEAIYDQLRGVAGNQMRSERSDHTLQATALANEAYLKLIDQDRVEWQNRVQFFAVASRAIRRILVDHARRRGRHKRGSGAIHLPLTEARSVPGQEPDLDLVALDEALTRLKAEDEFKCSIVEMKFFGGLKSDEIAEALQVSRRSVERHWEFARAWLYQQLSETES